MKYQMIVSDVDGTLVDDKKRISPRTVELIKRYQQMGGFFTLATGRTEISVRPYLDKLGIRGPVILYNGSRIVNVYDNTMVYDSSLDYDFAKLTLEVLKDFNYRVVLLINNTNYVSEMTPEIEEYASNNRIRCEIVPDLAAFLPGRPTKFLLIGDKAMTPAFIRCLSEVSGKTVNYVQSEPTYLEILPDGASKGEALKKLASVRNIPLERVAAVGDQLNDISMAKAAGLGVAMRNSNPDMLRQADYVTLSNEKEGVADLIDKIISDWNFKENK